MKLALRPPGSAEWPICRMLLPETFNGSSRREYLLAFYGDAPQLAAAVSFRRENQVLAGLRMHVIPAFRRRAIGSQIVAQLAQSGMAALDTIVDVNREPAAVPFCERNGFERVDALTTVEAEIAAMREYTGRLRERLTLPAGARVVPLREAPIEQAARLHAEYVAHDELNPWRARVAGNPGIGHSPVAVVDGCVAGILLWELEGETAVVRSRVVDPRHQGGWVNALLLAEGLEGAWTRGARTVRFCHTDSNRDTRKLAARFQAAVVGVMARFRRGEPPGGLRMAR